MFHEYNSHVTTSIHSDTDEWKSRLRSSALVNPKKESDYTILKGMRFVDSEEMMNMMNTAVKKHREMSMTCDKPEMEANRQKKWGVCWTYQLRCVNCTFWSEPFKLYKEVPNNKPGPNPAAPNVALATVLQDCPIGNIKTQEILARMNCPPPSRSSMNKMSNTVGKKTVELNAKDMADKLEIVKEVNRKRGAPVNEIDVAVDGRYNSQTICSKKKPGLNASQAFSLAIEMVTDMKYRTKKALLRATKLFKKNSKLLCFIIKF